METRSFDTSLLEFLICPVSGGKLRYDKDNQRLISDKARLAYPIKEGIAILLEEEAEKLEKK